MYCDSKIQGDANIEFHFASIVFKLRADTPTKYIGLLGIGFRQQQREFIASDAKGEIGGAHCFSEHGGGELQDLVALKMAAPIVHFF